MNRKIKFRSFRKSDNKLCIGDLFINQDTAFIVCGYADNEIETRSSIMRKYNIIINGQVNICKLETVGQYIRLNDKNGKEIYEGDILLCGEEKIEVEYLEFSDDGCFSAAGIGYEFGGYNFYEGKLRGEIIGNIFENPQLLENK